MTLPLGKLPPDLLTNLLKTAPQYDPRLVLKPGVGLDCAVVDIGDRYLVLKSDPITFAAENIGWYLVQVNSNDIATTGGVPRWLMVTMLLPEGQTTAASLSAIVDPLYAACREKGISVIGGHSEITYGLDRPILIGSLIGEVARDKLITPQGARPGDKIMLTKGIPIEATAILAQEFPERLTASLTPADLQTARAYLYQPGISVLRDAQLATAAGRVTAMHDPTEGGLAGALWELAEACGHHLIVDQDAVPVLELSARICAVLGLDPLAAIASGALLLTAAAEDAPAICKALEDEGILCAEIGVVEAGEFGVSMGDGMLLPRPVRDEIARLYEEGSG